MGERVLSLAAGTVLDVAPPTAVDIAAGAGYDAVGIWFDAAMWTAATTAAVRERVARTGVGVLDLEPVILGRGADHGEAAVDVGAEIGARHVLVASGPADRGAVVDRVAELCERAAPAGVVVVLEFLPIFSVATLADAVSVVEEIGHPSGAVLVDTLHLARSGGRPDDLRAVPARLLPYLQVADAPADAPERDQLRDEALHGRLLPGDGALPLVATLAAVPDVALSLEIRSSAQMARHPDPGERARAVLAATRRLLAEAG